MIARVLIRNHQTNPTLLSELAHYDVQLHQPVQQAHLFFLQGEKLQDEHIERLCHGVLCNAVTQSSSWSWLAEKTADAKHEMPASSLEITFHPGVTDRVAYEVQQAAAKLGLPALKAVTGRVYQLAAEDADKLEQVAQALSNPVIESYHLGQIDSETIKAHFADPVEDSTISIVNLDVSDEALEQLSQEYRLALNLAEMKILRDFAQQREGALQGKLRDAELEMVAQTWSEHCYHKTFRATIDFTETDAEGKQRRRMIRGLLNQYIRAATEELNKDWLVSVFVDNAGIVRFDADYDIAFKVETHNHPSALEPFGGANTGVGGVLRDVLGVSAKPIGVTDVLCFAPSDMENVPEGVLSPQRIQRGVVAGIGDYGNKMGVPNINGAILYHEGYVANPLVYCGCVGILPHGSHRTEPQVGDSIVVLGGKTGRDGLKGATFSSLDLDTETAEASFAATAVQIGDPIVEKDVMEVVLHARDAQLYTAITDCGAGGLSSAIGEMASELGAKVQLKDVALKYAGLRPWEIWLSEAQERMVLAVPEANIAALAELCQLYGVHYDVVGTMTGDAQMQVYYGDVPVVDLSMDLLHEQHPRLELSATWSAPVLNEQTITDIDIKATLLQLLARPTIASKEHIVRTYDHEVQGATVIKPFAGVKEQGPSDAAVLKPLMTPDKPESDNKGIIISNGINPRYGLIDPYRMALACVDEAVRNAVCVGVDPSTLSILDNFCWGNPNLPDRLGTLVKAVQGCYDAALLFETPFISGKDSLNNEYINAEGERLPIPGTLLISAMGITPDIRKSVSMDVKEVGNAIYLVGESLPEYGGSFFSELTEQGNNHVPSAPSNALDIAKAVFVAIHSDCVRACHDASEGGVAVALAEMCMAGNLGMALDIAECDVLFAESCSRYLVEVPLSKTVEFEHLLSGLPCQRIGEVVAEPVLALADVEVSVAEIEEAWRGHVVAEYAALSS